MPYALASTTASVVSLVASMLSQTKGCRGFQAREILSLYRGDKIAIEWSGTLLSKYYSNRIINEKLVENKTFFLVFFTSSAHCRLLLVCWFIVVYWKAFFLVLRLSKIPPHRSTILTNDICSSIYLNRFHLSFCLRLDRQKHKSPAIMWCVEYF